MVEIFMPKAGMDMKEGTLIRWLKEIGDAVELDEPIMEIETDKITMEAEAPATGILLSKTVAEGSVVPVLFTLGYIGEKGEKIPAEQVNNILATPYAKTLAAEYQVDLSSVQSETGMIHGKDVQATVLAKRAAEENGVNLEEITGSGFHGKITKADVVNQMHQSEVHQPEVHQPEVHQPQVHQQEVPQSHPFRTVETRQQLKGVRKVVGKRMFESYSQVPTVMQSMKVDMTELLILRKKVNENCENKISINDFIIKAVAVAVKELPHVRTMLVGEELVTYKEANIGFAVAVEEGLYVPVIRNADTLSVGEISKQAKQLAEKARTGTISPNEFSGGTFSISNMGMYDVHTFNPIINQPESGILGITGIEDVLKLINGEVTVRKEAVLCMSYDHRVMDGVGSAKLKKRVKELIEHPMEILV